MQNPQAVIEIGSTGIRLLVAEIVTTKDSENNSTQKKRNILDRSEVPLGIGRDVFTKGSISRETLLSCLRILNRFGEQLSTWGISRQETTVIGTSAVRSANNRDPFVDRIKIKTGFTVRVIDGIEENRLMYVAVRECLKDKNLLLEEKNSIILEITGASTEIMLMEKGHMVGAHSLRLGTILIDEKIRTASGSNQDLRQYVEEYIQNTKISLKTEINLHDVYQFIALGGDLKVAALFTGRAISPFLWQIDRKDFENLVEEVQRYTLEECIAHFKLSQNDAQTFQISLLAYQKFVALTNVKSILVPDTSLREGVILSQMSGDNPALSKEFNEQIVTSACTLLKKYQGDEKHAFYVAKLSLMIYDCMKDEMDASPHTRLLLEVSAILHDIGMLIRAKDHNLHSKYIIENSEIFGLTKDDLKIVASIAKFHRSALQPQEDAEVHLMARSDRMCILKLSAILRISDALDRSHQQKFQNITFKIEKDTLTIRTNSHSALNLEQLAVQEKGDLFENVFGYKILLL